MKRMLGIGIIFLFTLVLNAFSQENAKEAQPPQPVRNNNTSQPSLGVPQMQRGPLTPQGSPITDEMNKISDEEALQFIKTNMPPQYDNLIKAKDSNPDEFKRQIQRAKFMVYRNNKMKQDNPEQYARNEKMREINTSLSPLIKQYNEEKDENKKNEIKKQALDILSQEFDLRQQSVKANIERMKKGIEEQEKRLKENETKKDENVEKRFEQIVSRPNSAYMVGATTPNAPVSPMQPYPRPMRKGGTPVPPQATNK
jgi:hypothetical protein